MITTTIVLLLVLILIAGCFFAIGGLLVKLLYVCCIGLPIAICLGVCGLVCCITVIGIPVGTLLFKAAGFVLCPF